MSAAKHWCFTINNYTDDEVVPAPTDVTYIVMGREVGADGTPHLQGYLILPKPLRLNQVKRMMPRAHLEVMKGTPKQASDYCKKDGDYAEHGTLPGIQTANANKKRKADYDQAVELAKQQRLYEVDSGMLLRFGSSLRAIQKDHPIEIGDNDYLCGLWFVGAPGTGKSRTARWLFPKAYPKPLNKWWDGYRNEEYVIMDDFEPQHHVLGHHLKQWADHYPFTAEQKGTSIRIRPAILCITSNYRIEEIWAEANMQEAIRRRFQVTEF